MPGIYAFDLPGSSGAEVALSAVGTACRETGASYFLFGAMARNILMHQLRNVEWSPRLTRDVDVAVLVNNWDQYNRLKDRLQSGYGFAPTKWTHRFKTPEHINIDVVPFGGVEDERHHITWTGNVNGRMTVLGFKEALELVESASVEEIEVNVISMRAYGPIKLIAWEDRRQITPRDAEDFGFILTRYWEADTELIIESHADLIEEEDGDNDLIGARAYGRESTLFLSRNEELLSIITDLLDRETRDISSSRLAMDMGRDCHPDLERRFAILCRYFRGITEPKPNSEHQPPLTPP